MPQASIIRRASAPSRRQLRLLRLRSLCARRLLPRLRRPLLRPVRRNMEVFCHGCCRAVLTRGDLLMLLILLLLVVDGEEEDQLSVILTAAAFLLS